MFQQLQKAKNKHTLTQINHVSTQATTLSQWLTKSPQQITERQS